MAAPGLDLLCEICTRHPAFRSSSRQVGAAHEEAVALAGGAAASVDGPDDEGLAPSHVAGGEDAGQVGGEGAVLRLGVGYPANLASAGGGVVTNAFRLGVRWGGNGVYELPSAVQGHAESGEGAVEFGEFGLAAEGDSQGGGGGG